MERSNTNSSEGADKPSPEDLLADEVTGKVVRLRGASSADSVFSIEGVPAQALAHTARVLASWLLPTPESIAHVVVHDMHVWESSELPVLWSCFTRQHQGKLREAHHGWVYRCGWTDKDDLGGLLALILMFGWGFAGIETIGDHCLTLDHDGIVRLWGGSKAERSTFKEAIARDASG